MRVLDLEDVHVTDSACITDPGVTVTVMTRLLITPVDMDGRRRWRLSHGLSDVMVGASVVSAVHAQQMHRKHHCGDQGHHSWPAAREQEATKTGRERGVSPRAHTPPCVVIVGGPAQPN
ncbi:hypothetical protein [Nocardioides sp.]|uniref:hypothetical protein n=1 Tax=Nocardioides sp. TaxID=35761 RepID=UPI0019C98D28|nr:hypothetical protein [Nocardioides sp.]MBC7277388.1 hypothetical protein [Nocardioides sp.]